MRTFKKLILSLIVALSLVTVLQTITPELPITNVVQASSIKISKTKYTMNKGEKYTLKIKGTKKSVKWSSSNKKIATINSKGKVTAKKKGTVTITAKVGSKKYKCKIKVETPKINKTRKTLYINNTYTLKISGTSQQIKWSSSNKDVATVNKKGKVTAKKAGTATITAKIGSTKYKCKISVVNNANSITVGQANALKSANSYLDFLAFSKKGLKGQLEFEGYTDSEIDYAINNCDADWKKQALKSAKSYLDSLSFSKKGLIKQLEFEKFEDNEIEYAINNCNANWYEEAVECAKSYLNSSSFSRDSLYNQLEFEDFEADEIEYALTEVGY